MRYLHFQEAQCFKILTFVLKPDSNLVHSVSLLARAARKLMPIGLALLHTLPVCEGIRGPMNEVEINTTCIPLEEQKLLVRFPSQKLIYISEISLIRLVITMANTPPSELSFIWITAILIQIRSDPLKMQGYFQAGQIYGSNPRGTVQPWAHSSGVIFKPFGLINVLTNTPLSGKPSSVFFHRVARLVTWRAAHWHP